MSYIFSLSELGLQHQNVMTTLRTLYNNNFNQAGRHVLTAEKLKTLEISVEDLRQVLQVGLAEMRDLRTGELLRPECKIISEVEDETQNGKILFELNVTITQ